MTMSQNELRVLDHWRGVIGARSGDLTVSFEESVDLKYLEINSLEGPMTDGILSCPIANDWEPVIVIGQLENRWAGTFIVPRLPADVYRVLESPSTLILVEESKANLPFYRIENNRLVESVTVACLVSFSVRDLCPSVICEFCNRGAQRCKCSPPDRQSHLKDHAIQMLEAKLRLQGEICVAPIVPPLPLERVKSRSDCEAAVETHDALNDSFEDISACAVDHNKPILYCTCSVQ
ncbi:Hypothetical protein, putative [Bodo saltans]|uniref:Uncharacterized protein n=1 Tax=Bodo saltans TaxID=75058 RepID=A0A0S4KHR6_BODSA|nr:Hypothetical protein, putative [Bodo saltans]|eukprot:CUI15228.1 Hypothetical protein, putative [Bodo saltans]